MSATITGTETSEEEYLPQAVTVWTLHNEKKKVSRNILMGNAGASFLKLTAALTQQCLSVRKPCCPSPRDTSAAA